MHVVVRLQTQKTWHTYCAQCSSTGNTAVCKHLWTTASMKLPCFHVSMCQWMHDPPNTFPVCTSWACIETTNGDTSGYGSSRCLPQLQPLLLKQNSQSLGWTQKGDSGYSLCCLLLAFYVNRHWLKTNWEIILCYKGLTFSKATRQFPVFISQ